MLPTDCVSRAESLLTRYLWASSNTASADKSCQDTRRDRTFRTNQQAFRTLFAIE
jgi:hypothetical protein